MSARTLKRLPSFAIPTEFSEAAMAWREAALALANAKALYTRAYAVAVLQTDESTAAERKALAESKTSKEWLEVERARIDERVLFHAMLHVRNGHAEKEEGDR